MNIGIFTDTYFPQISGVATSTMMLERELTKLGHNVYIFTTSDPRAENVPNIFRLPSVPFVFLPTHRAAYLYPPKLFWLIKKLKLDIVHTQTEFPLGIFGRVVSEFFKIPTVHTYHTMYEDYVHYVANGKIISKGTAKRYIRIFCSGAKLIIAPVEKAKNSLLSYGIKCDIRVIPTGIDFEPFSEGRYSKEEIEAERKALGISECPTIITVGRVAKEKSIDVIIRQMPELLKRVPNVKFVVYGDGPARSELERLAASLDLKDSVIFAGAKPWESIGKYYRTGDVFVTASTSETQGLTHIEAMASGLPIVVKNDPSFLSVVTHEKNGLVFDTDEELTNCLERMLTDEALRQQISEEASITLETLSAEHFANQVISVYEDAIQSYEPPKIITSFKPLTSTIRRLTDFKLRWK